MLPDAHCSHALCYRLLTGDIDLEPLRILKTHCVEWHGWQVTALILGASHAVMLERDGERITELLTCLPPAGCALPLLEFGVCDHRPKRLCVSGLEWDVRLWTCDWEETEDALLLLSSNTLHADFPATYSPQKPQTSIHLLPTPAYLQITTRHTYPQEARSVHTRTVLLPIVKDKEAEQ